MFLLDLMQEEKTPLLMTMFSLAIKLDLMELLDVIIFSLVNVQLLVEQSLEDVMLPWVDVLVIVLPVDVIMFSLVMMPDITLKMLAKMFS